MISSIRPRPVPDRPVASWEHLRIERLDGSPGVKIDLSTYRGQSIRLTVEGVVEATNIHPGNARTLLELCVFGACVAEVADVIEFDPAHTRGDLYMKWALGMPKPAELRDFDRVTEVRGLLHLPAETPHPRHFVEGAFEFLKDHGCATIPEAKQLLHFSPVKDDPTWKMFAEISGSKQQKVSTTATLRTLRTRLPRPVRTVAGTALDAPDPAESIFAAPPPGAIGDLVRMSALQAPASIHILRLAARVVSPIHLTAVLRGLREIDKRIEDAKSDGDRTLDQAARDVLRKLMAASAGKTREGRKAGNLLNAWSGMIEDLRIPIAQLREEDRHILNWPSTICPDLIAANRTRRHFATKKSQGAARLQTSSSLADELPQVIRGVDARYREIENLRVLAQDARAELRKSTGLTSIPIVQDTAELDEQGSPTGSVVTHRYRLWDTEALLKSIIAASEEPPAPHSILGMVSKGRFPPTLTPTILIHEGGTGNLPWFIPFFAAGLFNSARALPLDVRQRRYELLRDLELPAVTSKLPGLLTYNASDGRLARSLLGQGIVAIPIDEFGIAMQLAHTAFSLALVTAARVGEICQIHIDGGNFGYDEDHELAYWIAQPKQQADRMDPEPTTRRYYVDERSLAAVVSLRQTMMDFLGPDRAAQAAHPSQNMRKLGEGPWLFRGETSMLHPRVVKAFLQYLSAGIASFGIHDVRAAVAKHRYDQGDSMDEIRELLGHGGVWATRGYARPTEKMMARKRKDRKMLTDAQRRLARLDEIRRRMA